jgi:predicted DNA-binding protein
MSKQQDRAKLRGIVNHAVAEYGKFKYDELDEEIKRYQSEYFQKRAAQKRDKTENDVSFAHEVALAVDFCEMLEAYRASIDPYREDTEPISEKMARDFTQKIDEIEPMIDPENKSVMGILKKIVARHLPEMKDHFLAEDYINKIKDLYKEKKKTKKTDKGRMYSFEIAASSLLKEISSDEDVKNMKADQDKLNLLLNCVKLVDCLSPIKYNKSTKFKYKSQIYQAAYKVSKEMGNKDLMQKYLDESERFSNACDRALEHVANYEVQQKIRNARHWDDYLNK